MKHLRFKKNVQRQDFILCEISTLHYTLLGTIWNAEAF
jgi:hypothetical protein